MVFSKQEYFTTFIVALVPLVVSFHLPEVTLNREDIRGQNVTVAGGLSGLSMEASFGSGELVMNPNGTLLLLRPYLSGVPQSLGVNPAAAWLLGDRKKRQVVTPQGIQIQGSPLQVPTYTIDIGGQNVTVAGSLSGLSMEASFGSGELVMNPNGTISLLRPYLSGVPQSLGVNPAAAWLLGDRKKRQVVTPQDIGGQNVTVAGGLSGLSMEASFGSGELVLNPNGTLYFIAPPVVGNVSETVTTTGTTTTTTTTAAPTTSTSGGRDLTENCTCLGGRCVTFQQIFDLCFQSISGSDKTATCLSNLDLLCQNVKTQAAG